DRMAHLSPSGDPVIRWPSRELVARVGAGLIGAAAIAGLLRAWLGPTPGPLALEVAGRPLELLAPGWLYLLAFAPYFVVVQAYSLTDVSVVQRSLATGLRIAIVAGLSLALARPAVTTHGDQIATAVL